uniref:Rho-GAP domain-containing protein n=1 Tax=Knipowitschia caucasica TaxID=637954 RepID=A0AAV2K3B4_KNICA
MSKRRLRQTRSLDPALMRHFGNNEDEEKPLEPYTIQDDFTWSSVSGRSVGLKPVPLQSLSELERNRLQDVAFRRLLQDCDLGCHISIPKSEERLSICLRFLATGDSYRTIAGSFRAGISTVSMLIPDVVAAIWDCLVEEFMAVPGAEEWRSSDGGIVSNSAFDDQKHKKSLRQKLDSLSKEKNKDKETPPQAFGIPLSQVIANDRMHKQRPDLLRPEHSDPSELMLSFLHLTSSFKRTNKDFSSSNSSLSSTCETPNESPLQGTPDPAPRTRRRGGVSVDCITDLDDSQSRLLEALQLSLPVERKKRQDKKLSLNPIYRQVPRVVDLCCQHLEKEGLQTVGVFRVGSSKKRVRQLREDFDQGWEVNLDEEHSVHDVAALLKEFLRDLPDPLLTRELYTAFIHTMMLDLSDQDRIIQLLLFLLPPCNSDTLQRLLCLLSTVTKHSKDAVDKEGHEVTGNKMTSLNLATIFGPNLLHKLKCSDKEFVVESLARVEESTAIISLVQRMIDTYDTLFMVTADLQNEVLKSLLETDRDVVDYLLRRKASHISNADLIRAEEHLRLTSRCLSSDSIKASSGEVSPYDNNSPIFSSHLMCDYPTDSSSLSSKPTLHSSSNSSPTLSNHKLVTQDPFWDDWHDLFHLDFRGHCVAGSAGDTSECESYGSSEGLSSHQEL